MADNELTLEQALAELNGAKVKLTEREASIASRDEEITTLKGSFQATAIEKDRLLGGLNAAVSRYKTLALQANPTVPEELISGATIEEVDAAVDRAKTIVDKVKAQNPAPAPPAPPTIPSGAPPRTGPETGGMSAKEKIAYGLHNPPK